MMRLIRVPPRQHELSHTSAATSGVDFCLERSATVGRVVELKHVIWPRCVNIFAPIKSQMVVVTNRASPVLYCVSLSAACRLPPVAWLQVPTGAIMYTVGAHVSAREAIFIHRNNDTGMLAVHAGSDSVFQAQECSFIGWVGSNVVSAVLCCCFMFCVFYQFFVYRCVYRVYTKLWVKPFYVVVRRICCSRLV